MGTVACTRAAPLPLPSLTEDRDLLYVFTSMFRFTKLFDGLDKFSIYFWRKSRGLLRLWCRRARAHASSERGCVTFCNHAVRTGSKVSFLYVTPFSLSFFLLFFSVSWISLYSSRHRTYYYTDEAKRWNRSQGFFYPCHIYIYIYYIYIFLYVLFNYFFFFA